MVVVVDVVLVDVVLVEVELVGTVDVVVVTTVGSSTTQLSTATSLPPPSAATTDSAADPVPEPSAVVAVSTTRWTSVDPAVPEQVAETVTGPPDSSSPGTTRAPPRGPTPATHEPSPLPVGTPAWPVESVWRVATATSSAPSIARASREASAWSFDCWATERVMPSSEVMTMPPTSIHTARPAITTNPL